MSSPLANVAGTGCDIPDQIVTASIRGVTDVVPGDVVVMCALDYLRIGTTTAPTSTPGPINSIFASFTKDYTATAGVAQICGVALDAIKATASTTAANAPASGIPVGRIQVTGRVRAKVISSCSTAASYGTTACSTWARGAPLCLSDGTGGGSSKGTLDAIGYAQAGTAGTSVASTHSKSSKIIGYALSSGSGSVATLQEVWFDGISGFGAYNNSLA